MCCLNQEINLRTLHKIFLKNVTLSVSLLVWEILPLILRVSMGGRGEIVMKLKPCKIVDPESLR